MRRKLFVGSRRFDGFLMRKFAERLLEFEQVSVKKTFHRPIKTLPLR